MEGAGGDWREEKVREGSAEGRRPQRIGRSSVRPSTSHLHNPSEEMKGIDVNVGSSAPHSPSLHSSSPPSHSPPSDPSLPPPSSSSSPSPPDSSAPSHRRRSRTPWDLLRRMTSRLLTDSAPVAFSLNEPKDPALATFPSNVIRTSKYSVITFLPLNLWEQFHRLANQYFLFIILIQLIPNVSPFPIYTSVIPLAFILVVSALSEAREDWVRHRADAVANSRKSTRVNETGGEEVLTSSQVRVGDILKIGKGEEFPADLILLVSSREDHTAYVNTANLDGEAAPKVRICPQATSGCHTGAEVAALKGRIKYEQPSTSLYRFQGQVHLDQAGGDGSRPPSTSTNTFGLGDKQLLLRGSRLINTDYVYGLVVYCGPETKMMLNRNPSQLKFSRYEQGLNRLVIVVLIINLVVCLLLSFFYVGVSQDWPCEFDYCATDGSQWLLGFLTQYILFSFMVPQSLYVTIQLIKIGQALFIQWDNAMGYTDPDTGEYRRAAVKSNSLNEELGHIDAICTDKTGTLTQNRMQLSKVSVECQLYFQSSDRREDSIASSHGQKRPPPHLLVQDLVHSAFSSLLTPDDGDEKEGGETEGLGETTEDGEPHFHTPRKERPSGEESVKESLAASPSSSSFSSPSADIHLDFVLNLLLCNAVLPDLKATEDGSTQRVIFQSQSPDEIALVESLHECGVTLVSRSGDQVTVRVALPGYRVYTAMYTILAVLEFSSTWRRMSVIVRLPDQSIRLYVKGADTTLAALADQSTAEQRRLLETTMGHVTDFAVTGSRTLVMAGKSLSDAEFSRWYDSRYHPAETALEDRDNQIERSFAQIEGRLTLLGASAVDDQLQEFVAQTVDFLLAAEIKIVVLTGDKLETAVTIAKQSHLIMPGVRVVYVAGVTQAEVESALNAADAQMKAELEQAASVHAVQVERGRGAQQSKVGFALAIDGVCLELALVHCKTQFLSIFKQCDTIVSYRSTPLQKALVVKMCKTDLALTTLAVGDGANDVSMIQEAHVGVGVMGKEGAHAAMSSDFVIHRFHHLVRLLCLHGRWCYWRTTQVVFFSFYKVNTPTHNPTTTAHLQPQPLTECWCRVVLCCVVVVCQNFVFPLPLFWFQFWALGSGTNMYDSLLVTLFNTFFTSIPPLMIGISDKDVQDEILLAYPQAYAAFKRDDPLTVFGFVYMILSGWYQSAVVFFLIYGMFGINDVISNTGRAETMYVMGDIAITAVVLITNVYMIINAAALTILNWVGLAIGLILYICTFIFFTASWEPSFTADGYGLGIPVFGTVSTYLYLLIAIVLSLGPTQTLMCYWRLTRPLTYQTLQMLPIPKKEKNYLYHRQATVKHLLQKQSSINIEHKGGSGSATSPHNSLRRSNGVTPPNEMTNGLHLSPSHPPHPPSLQSSPLPPNSPLPSDDVSLVPSTFLSSSLTPRPLYLEELQGSLQGREGKVGKEVQMVGSSVPSSDVELQRVVASGGSATTAKRLSSQRKMEMLEGQGTGEDRGH